MQDLYLGVLDEALAWTVEQTGRLLVRVRSLATPPGPDAWYVLVPEVPQHLTSGGHDLTVTVSLVVSASKEVGAKITVEGDGTSATDVTVFLNVGTTAPSFVYFGVLAGKHRLPTRVAATVTTPIPLPTVTSSVTARLEADGIDSELGLRLGRADLPVVTQPAKVEVTLPGLTTAISRLAAKGITLSGLPLLDGLGGVKTSLNVQEPSADTGAPALKNNAVTDMTDLVAIITQAGAATFALQPLTVTADMTQSGGIARTELTYKAQQDLDVMCVASVKDSHPREGLMHRTRWASFTAHSVPREITTVLSAMPEIVYGGASPQPSAAEAVVAYAASARLKDLDFQTFSDAQVVSPPPAGPPPPTASSAHLYLEDLPRGARFWSGQWDPNHVDDVYVRVDLLDGAGAPDKLTLGRFAAAQSAVPPTYPTDLPGTQRFTSDAGAAEVRGVVSDLRHVAFESEPRKAAPTTVVTNDVSATYDAVSALPAIVKSVGKGGDTTTVSIADLPASVEARAQFPDNDTIADLTKEWAAHATWKASAPATVEVKIEPPSGVPVPPADRTKSTTRVEHVPAQIELFASGDASGMLDLEWDAANKAQAGPASASLYTTQYTKPGNPFVSIDASATSIPSHVAVRVDRNASGADALYSSDAAVDRIEATYTSTDLQRRQPGQFVAFDHAEVTVAGLPQIPGDPALYPVLHCVVTSAPAQPPLVHIDVPQALGAAPIERIHVKVVDKRPTSAADDTFATGYGLRYVRRKPPDPTDFLPNAPAGSLVVVDLPHVRRATFDAQTGTSYLPPGYSIAPTALGPTDAPLAAHVALDAQAQLEVDIALDAPTQPELDVTPGTELDTSTWLTAKLPGLQEFALDGQVPATHAKAGTGSHLAFETSEPNDLIMLTYRQYDHAPGAVPNYAGDPESQEVAQDQRRTSAFAALLPPPRLELRLDCPQAKLDQSSFLQTSALPNRIGNQILSTESTIMRLGQTLALYGAFSVQHGWDISPALWQELFTRPQAYAQYDIRRVTTAFVQPGPPEPRREVQTTGTGPNKLRQVKYVNANLSVAFQELWGVEMSKQGALPPPGSGAKQRLAARWQPQDWSLPVEVRHLENEHPVAEDHFKLTVDHIHDWTEVFHLPEAQTTENGLLAEQLTVDAGPLHITADGTWRYGFPHINPPTDTPTLTTDPAVKRPSGVTQLHGSVTWEGLLDVQRGRHWADPAPPASGLFTFHEQVNVACGALSADGFVVTDRDPRSFANELASRLTAHTAPLFAAIQGTLRVPDYSKPVDQTTSPYFLRPGQSPTPHSFAMNVNGLQMLSYASDGLCDNDLREVPVFFADDAQTFQPGTSATDLRLAFTAPAGPAQVIVNEREEQDWQDSPAATPGIEAVRIELSDATPANIRFHNETQVSALPGKRPTRTTDLTVASTTKDLDFSGPALGNVLVALRGLETAGNVWAPIPKRLQAEIKAPGFIRLATGTHQDIGRFPDATSTSLDFPSFDTLGVFGNDTSSTGRLQGWLSGNLEGTLTVLGPDYRRVSSVMPAAWVPPSGFEIKRTDADLTATVTGAMTATLPAMLEVNTTAKGLPTPVSEGSGLALFAACGFLNLSGSVVSSTLYDQTYPEPGPQPAEIAKGTAAATLELDHFAGRLSVQARDEDFTGLLVDAFAAALALCGNPITYPGGIIVAELAFFKFLKDNSPIRVDSLCSGTWRLYPPPSAREKMSLLEPFVIRFEHDTAPSDWVLTKPGLVIVPLLIAALGGV